MRRQALKEAEGWADPMHDWNDSSIRLALSNSVLGSMAHSLFPSPGFSHMHMGATRSPGSSEHACLTAAVTGLCIAGEPASAEDVTTVLAGLAKLPQLAGAVPRPAAESWPSDRSTPPACLLGDGLKEAARVVSARWCKASPVTQVFAFNLSY